MSEFNLSAAIREVLAANPNASASEAMEAIQKKNPKAKINKGSFSVGFYTGRQKLGITSKRKTRDKIGIRKASGGTIRNGSIDLDTLSAAATFLREAGSVDAALAAIKSVQAVQIGG